MYCMSLYVIKLMRVLDVIFSFVFNNGCICTCIYIYTCLKKMVPEELKCIAFPDIRNTSCCIIVNIFQPWKRSSLTNTHIKQLMYILSRKLKYLKLLKGSIHSFMKFSSHGSKIHRFLDDFIVVFNLKGSNEFKISKGYIIYI